MNFNAFFDDIKNWMIQCNDITMTLGFGTEQFFVWVFKTLSELVEKYNNHDFAMAQIRLLIEWLEEQSKGA